MTIAVPYYSPLPVFCSIIHHAKWRLSGIISQNNPSSPQSSSAFRLPRKQDHLFLDVETWELPNQSKRVGSHTVSCQYDVSRLVTHQQSGNPTYVAHAFFCLTGPLQFSVTTGDDQRSEQRFRICQPERISRYPIPSLRKKEGESVK